MTVYLDTSALVATAIEGTARQTVIDALNSDTNWFSSALSIGEAMALVARLTGEEVLRYDLEDAVRLLWDRIAIVPVDQACLDQAALIMHERPVRIADAIHLSAASRLPRPAKFVTFDPHQIPSALSLGFDVVSD